MSRVKLSTTVDEELLSEARRLHEGMADSALVEAGRAALVRELRDEPLARLYAEAYKRYPADEPDDWGDVRTLLDADGGSC